MLRRQRGMTAIGFILVAAIFGIVGFGAIKLTPIYLEHFRVQQLLNSVKSEWDSQSPSIAQIRTSIQRRLDIESISSINARDFDVIRSDHGFIVGIDYESRTAFVGNIHLLVIFDSQVEIRR